MTNKQNKIHAVFVGGETSGPIVPLIALAKAWQEQEPGLCPLFIDVRKSVGARIVPQAGFEFKSIVAGKMRRYWTYKNFFTPFKLIIGFIQSLMILKRAKPVIVVGAGGYVQIPLMYAAWVLRIPRLVHQQDIIPTLANKIVAPIANHITTTFERSVKDFSQGLGFSKNYAQYHKVSWTGNPGIPPTSTREQAQKIFKTDPDWPTVLVYGGGSGAIGINQALIHNLPELLKVAQVLHSTGVGKRVKPPIDIPAVHDRYHQYEYIDHMNEAYTLADVVIARAGIGTITRLSNHGKIGIIIPMPNSHQEANAQYLFEHNAAIVLDHTEITPESFAKLVRKILFDVHLQKQIQAGIHGIMPQNATENMLKIIFKLIQPHGHSIAKSK